MPSFYEWAKRIAAWRQIKGFTTCWDNAPEKLLLVITEICEATEALRKSDMEGFREEIADTFIRLLDLCGTLDIDIEAEIEKKMEINWSRPQMHNKKF